MSRILMRWDRNFTILPYAYGLNARHIKGELKEFHALLDHLSLHQRSWTCRHLSPRTMAFTAILLFLYYFYCNTDKYSQQKFFSEFRQNAKNHKCFLIIKLSGFTENGSKSQATNKR